MSKPYDTDEVEIDFPIIMPEVKIDRLEVKPIVMAIKSDIIRIVIDLFEPKPEPTLELKFYPNEFVVVEKIVAPKIYIIPDVMPEFEGGLKEMFKYLGNNLKYPEREKNIGIHGTDHLTFVVGEKRRN